MEDTKNITQSSGRHIHTFVIAAIFLAPIFFLPIVSFQFGKMLVIALPVLIASLLYFVSVYKEKEISFPKAYLLLLIPSIPFVFLLSSLFAESFNVAHVSLIGYGFEVWTTTFITLLFSVLFLIINSFRQKERVFYAYLAFFSALVVVLLFQIIRLFSSEILVFNTFVGSLANMIGKWNDLGIFLSVGVVLSLITLETVSLSSSFKNILRVLLGTSLFVMLIINFRILWVFVALASLLVWFFARRSSRISSNVVATDVAVPKKTPIYVYITLVVSVIAFFGFGFIGNFTYSKLGISYLEVKPDWVATFNVGKAVIAQNPVFGVGPNRFLNAWYAFKPISVNSDPFWNVEFDFAVATIPTYMITTGLLGMVGFMLFFVFFALTIVKAYKLSVEDSFSRYLLFSSAVVSLFLWVINIFYVSGPIILLLTFVFTGLFLATFYMLSERQVFVYSWKNTKGLLPRIALVLLMLGTLYVGFLITSRALSSVYFQKSLQALNTSQNIDESIRLMNKAISTAPHDIYYRGLSELYLIKLNGLVAGTITPATTLQADVQQTYSQALYFAGEAVKRHRTNYYNWVAYASVYEAVIGTGVADAYINAAGIYEQAVLANPTDPRLFLMRARLEVSQRNFDKAKEFIQIAVALKPNFTEAVFLWAQIDVELGNIKGAISAVESAITRDVNNSLAYFQLGFLKYNDKDYRGSVDAFDKAIILVPDYANAMYFRGLSLFSLGEKEKALADFEFIKQANPDNKEIALIVSNLKAGKKPLAGTEEISLETPPEEKDELPLEE
ncbi:MAG: hypothetical protein RJA61_7 [Candidatus Parcubacteria bacterium]|jgi:tetratricopeptide (TPR) repeat protein